jgi:hypothetical protein
MRLTHALRGAAILAGAATLIAVAYATPILWRNPDTRWALLMAWPLGVAGIRALRAGITGDAGILRKIDDRLDQLRRHRETYHRG